MVESLCLLFCFCFIVFIFVIALGMAFLYVVLSNICFLCVQELSNIVNYVIECIDALTMQLNDLIYWISNCFTFNQSHKNCSI